MDAFPDFVLIDVRVAVDDGLHGRGGLGDFKEPRCVEQRTVAIVKSVVDAEDGRLGLLGETFFEPVALGFAEETGGAVCLDVGIQGDDFDGSGVDGEDVAVLDGLGVLLRCTEGLEEIGAVVVVAEDRGEGELIGMGSMSSVRAS